MSVIVNANSANITKVANSLKNGEVVAFPTETVYGLGANALSSLAVKQIFTLKKRPFNNPLILHFYNLDAVKEYFTLSSLELEIAKLFWPGALTLVLNNPTLKAQKISNFCKGNARSIAVRVPNNTIALQVIKEANCPIAAPSANISNHLSPTTANHVLLSFKGSNLLILDGGKSVLGLESTVIEVINNSINILRFGSVTKEMLLKLNLPVTNIIDNILKSPGLLKKHYSPNTPLRLNAKSINKEEALLAFGTISKDLLNSAKILKKVLNLSTTANLAEAASNLFEMLWELDLENYNSIAVMPIPNVGIGAAINERLKKAATKNI